MAVTKYMAIKWVEAAFEIVIAIIVIVFGQDILFGIVPESNLWVVLLWLLAIWCIIAAVRNIVLSLRPEPKNSLRTLNERVDALDKRLVTMGLASSEMIPDVVPPSPEDLKKGKKKRIMIAAGIVAVIVVLAAIATVFLMAKMGGGGGNPAGGSTPEETFNALITAMNSKDANRVLSLTVYSFGNASIKSQFRQEFNNQFGQAGNSFNITVNDHQIKYPADLSASENSNLTGIQNEIQNRISKTITASCVIVFNLTITANQTSFYQDGNMPCFQIDGGWYVLIDFGDGGPDDGGGDQQSPERTFQGFIENLNLKDAPGAISFTVAKFASGTERSNEENNISSMWQSTTYFNITVDNYQVRDWSMLNPTEQNNLSGIQGNVSAHFGVTITESCFVQYSITISNDSGQRQMTGDMPCFKIDNLWYLKMETPSGSPTVELMQDSTGTNWTLTVTKVDLAGGPSLYTSNVFLTVKYANGTKAVNMTLDALMGAGWVNGTRFNDNNVPGQLDQNDMFQLDSAIYLINSEVKLRNSDGTQVYCNFTIV